MKGEQLGNVVRRRGLDSAAVEEAVRQYNETVSRDQPDPYGRPAGGAVLAEGPWVLLGPVKAYFTTTEGGAAVNQQMQVLDDQGQVIAGLYAVGQNGLGGMVLWGHGLHIAWAMTSGRLAGQFVLQDQ